MNSCPGAGSCYYDPDDNNGEDCKSCNNVDGCEDYKNELDCELDRCILQLDHKCEWNNGACRENLDCGWDWANIYSTCVNELATKINNCRLISGECDPINDNPARTYPNHIACPSYTELVDFPVFTHGNLIVSLFLLIGYYFVRRKII